MPVSIASIPERQVDRMSERMYKHLFGPVPSRRLGRSLGVDLVPLKTCSFNCVFCQVGLTPQCTVERKEYIPFDDVVREFDAWLGDGGIADTVTLSGSGEPTLHLRFGDMLRRIRERCSIRTALLSNGSLFWDAGVRASAGEADLVKLSLSAWDQASLVQINRPEGVLRLDRIVEGMQTFRREFDGELWLEVVVLAGMNAGLEHMQRIADLARLIRPDRIHLNSVTRPPAESFAVSPPDDVLEKIAALFEPRAEMITAPSQAPAIPNRETVGRRPIAGNDFTHPPQAESGNNEAS